MLCHPGGVRSSLQPLLLPIEASRDGLGMLPGHLPIWACLTKKKLLGLSRTFLKGLHFSISSDTVSPEDKAPGKAPRVPKKARGHMEI